MKVLMITKPLVPPWDDSAKNLARDILLHCPEVRFHALTSGEFSFEQKHIREERLYSDAGAYQPPLWNNIKVFFRLLKPDDMDLYHFFFAPNRKTSTMAKLALNMQPHIHTVQTVCSAPQSFDGIQKLCFADHTITVSKDTRDKLIAAGVNNVRCIYPAVADEDIPTEQEKLANRRAFKLPERGVIALFAGDLDFSNAAETLLEALPEALKEPDLTVVFCNRVKTPAAEGIRERIKQRVNDMNLQERVLFIPAQKDLRPLLRAIDIMLMHPDTLYAKMDLPLVLLESMSHGTPPIVSSLPMLQEALQSTDAGLTVQAGDAAGLAQALRSLTADPELRKRIGQTAREVVRAEFSMETLGAHYRELYREIGS